MTKLYGEIKSKNELTGNLGAKNEINVEIIGTGARGLSAYQIWLKNGNVGSEQDFLDSLAGGGSGTSNYELLRNKPSINQIELNGNKTFIDLGVETILDSEINNLF